ncbi:hypothetical protein N665_0235s0022 [Sinapis alba]|nr:hypothetical protein N665_0235s0022 [Sinapis alba]
MATTSNTTKAKMDNDNLTRTKSMGRKPKQPSSVSSEDGSDQKPEKPLPNYLKPTISSRPDPVKFLKKNDQDNQKLLRRRSFDRPPSSLTSASTPTPRIQKTLNVSSSMSRDKPTVPREKPATASLRSSSFHGSRGVPRGSTSLKSPHVAPKKSGLSSGSTSLKSKKEGSENVVEKKAPEKEIALDTASLSSAQEDEEETLKVESDAQVDDDIEEPKEEMENKEVHVEVVHAGEENESGGLTLVAPVEEDIVVSKENEKEEEERLINEHNSEEKIEENKEQENKQENMVELTEEVTPKIDEDETSEKVDADMNTKEVEKVEEVESVEETTEEKEEVKEEKEKVNKEEKEEVKDEEKDKVKEESGEGKKREVVKGKKESPSAYNDVIASKMQENPRKNKVLALAGAFQTVIDYESAASK